MSVIPADSTGTYPALTGYTPMLLGRRIGIAVVDVVIIYAVYFVSVFVMIQAGTDVGAFLGMGLMLALVVVELWALFAKSARLSGVFMHAVYVDVQTGFPAPGKVILKALLQSLLSFVSCGIAPLIIVLASVQPPLQRNWFDRTVGLMLVDARTGRQPAGPAPVQSAPLMGAPAIVRPPEPLVAGPFPGTEAAAPDSGYAQLIEPDRSYDLPVEPDYEYDQTSTPLTLFRDQKGWYGQSPVPPVPTVPPVPPVPPAPSVAPDYLHPAVIQGVPGVESVDHTRQASFAAYRPSVLAQLDDGTPLSLTPPTVLGRNPVAPVTHPSAHVISVNDPSMETSKTHLMVGEDNSLPWVVDLHSANGVYVTDVGSPEPVRLAPGERRNLSRGATIGFGSRRIRIS